MKNILLMVINLHRWILNFNKVCLYFLIILSIFKMYPYDLTIMGNALYSDGLGRISITTANMLKDDLSINFYFKATTPWHNPRDIAFIDDATDSTIGNVLLFTTILWHFRWPHVYGMPKAKINMAYSMLEGTKIPATWVKILNEKFDSVVVPDEYLREVYVNSGVLIPVYVLPLAVDLEKFLNTPIKREKNKIFVFGSSASFIERKNHEKVLEAFIKTFGNNPNVKLILHGRNGSSKPLNDRIKKGKVTNVKIIHEVLNESQYLEFMKGLDCYILASKGEGFSVTPREALALGIPCILSDNTSHKTICSELPIYPLKCTILEKAHYGALFHGEDTGYQSGPSVDEISRALLHVYKNYDQYLNHANGYREWAKFYLSNNLKPLYRSLIKPQSIVLGSTNSVTADFIMTDSPQLYEKYQSLNG